MLNNDLNELIRKYERYKRERFWARLLLLLIFIGGLFYLFNYFKSTNVITDTQTNKSIETSDKNSSKDDSNSSENNQSTGDNLIKNLSDEQKRDLKRLMLVDKKKHSYESSIDIAKYYLSIEQYKEAIMWSIKASKLNNKSVKPWIVYAKSKQALGKEAMAIKALQIYLGQHTSDEARELLSELKK